MGKDYEHRIDGRLTTAEDAQLTALIRAHGYEPLARRLGVSPTIIHKLENGGFATRPPLDRVRAGLAKMRGVAA